MRIDVGSRHPVVGECLSPAQRPTAALDVAAPKNLDAALVHEPFEEFHLAIFQPVSSGLPGDLHHGRSPAKILIRRRACIEAACAAILTKGLGLTYGLLDDTLWLVRAVVMLLVHHAVLVLVVLRAGGSTLRTPPGPQGSTVADGIFVAALIGILVLPALTKHLHTVDGSGLVDRSTYAAHLAAGLLCMGHLAEHQGQGDEQHPEHHG